MAGRRQVKRSSADSATKQNLRTSPRLVDLSNGNVPTAQSNNKKPQRRYVSSAPKQEDRKTTSHANNNAKKSSPSHNADQKMEIKFSDNNGKATRRPIRNSKSIPTYKSPLVPTEILNKNDKGNNPPYQKVSSCPSCSLQLGPLSKDDAISHILNCKSRFQPLCRETFEPHLPPNNDIYLRDHHVELNAIKNKQNQSHMATAERNYNTNLLRIPGMREALKARRQKLYEAEKKELEEERKKCSADLDDAVSRNPNDNCFSAEQDPGPMMETITAGGVIRNESTATSGENDDTNLATATDGDAVDFGGMNEDIGVWDADFEFGQNEEYIPEWMDEYVNSMGPSDRAKDPLKFKGNLKGENAVQTELLFILNKHSRLDLGLHDEIMEWLEYYGDINWKWRKPRKRDAMIEFLSHKFDLERRRPKAKTVNLKDRSVTMPVYSLKEAIRSLTSDPKLMHSDNLLENDFDHETWRPTVEVPSDDDVMDDIHKGDKFRKAHSMYCPDKGREKNKQVRGVGAIIFSDKTNVDRHGALGTTPLLMTLTVFNKDCRQTFPFWRVIGMIPNQQAGMGTNHVDPDTKKSKPASEKNQDFHTLLRPTLEQFDEIRRDGGVWVKIDGEDVLLKVWIHLVIGDAVGNNELCGHSNGSSSACLSKDCRCTHSQLSEIPRQCEKVTIQDMMQVKVDHDFAHSLSKYSIHNAFDGLPLSDFRYGILGITPFERLHMLASGIIEHSFIQLREMIGEGQKNAKEKGELDDLFDRARKAFSRQSCRDVCRSSGRFGVMDMTRITAMERVGNFHIMLVCLKTDEGMSLLKKCLKDYNRIRKERAERKANGEEEPDDEDEQEGSDDEDGEGEGVESHDDDEDFQDSDESDEENDHFDDNGMCTRIRAKDVIKTMEWLISFFVWMHDSHNRGHLNRAQPMVEKLMRNIYNYLPREKITKKEKKDEDRSGNGTRGWDILKFHAVLGVVQDLLDFGNGLSFAGDCGEKFHQYVVKTPGFQTQKRCDTFTSQVADNVFDTDVVNFAYSHSTIGNHIMFGKRELIGGKTPYRDRGNDYYTIPENLNGVNFVGKFKGDFTYAFHRNTHTYHFEPTWHDKDKEKCKHPICPEFIQHVRYFAQRKDYHKNFSITGFTELRYNGEIYRAAQWYRAFPWFDWAHVYEPTDKQEMQGKILGFFKYETPGFPSWKYADREGMSVSEIDDQQLRDDTMYMVIHACDDWCSRVELESEMCRYMSLAPGDDYVYILPVHCIRGPLAAIPNYGSYNGSLNYISALPYHKWGNVFKTFVDSQHQ